MYVLLLHLWYFLMDAQLVPEYALHTDAEPDERLAWHSVTANQRVQLRSNAASCMAQILDDVDSVAAYKVCLGCLARPSMVA